MAFMTNAVIVCVTAVLVVYAPELWTKTRPIITGGTVQQGFEPVAKLFRENFETGVEYPTGGSAFSVYYKGSKVVDIWGGYADTEADRPWNEDTLTVVFSTTKDMLSCVFSSTSMAALCIAMMVDRGLLDYDKTVASYWPEFAQNGKENITVRMLINHQAGLANITDDDTLHLLGDQDALGEFLARHSPEWEPGTTLRYHAFSFGLYASQLLRRADPKHRTLGQFFKEEIAQPFGIDFHIGLPLELYHRFPRLKGASRYMWFKELITNPVFGKIMWQSLASGLSASLKPIQFEDYMSPERLILEQPSVSGVGTARAIAKVYGVLANGGTTTKGQRLLSNDVIKEIIAEKRTDKSFQKPTEFPITFSLGFVKSEYKGAQRFGHSGAGGMHGLADPQRKLSLGYVSSYSLVFLGRGDKRFEPLQEETYRCIEKLEST